MARPKKSLPQPPGQTELIEPAVSDAIIDGVYYEVRGILRDGTLNVHLRIGKVILDNFYGGDVAVFRSRGEKDSSLRKLADRFKNDDGNSSSASALYRAVAVYDLDQRLDVSARKQLTLTHVKAVLGLPEEAQRRLLDQAESQGLTTRQLEEKAKKDRKKEGERRGRPPLPSFEKSIHVFKSMLDSEEAFTDLDKVQDLHAERVRALYETVTQMKLKCEELQKALQAKAPVTLWELPESV